MPFDGLHDPRPQYLLDKLEAVSSLLPSQDRWCKQALRDADGRRCLLGALIDARARTLLYYLVIEAAATEAGRSYERIETFNDDPTTNFETIQAVLDRVRAEIVAGRVSRGPLQRIAGFIRNQMRKVMPELIAS